MPAGQTVEERLDALELALAEVQRRLPPAAADWISRVTGSQKEEPAFEEVLEYGRTFRQADRPAEDGA